MQALICVEPWHSAMMGLFTQYPSPFFIEGEETPRFLPRFGRDCREKLLAFYKDIHDMSIEELNEDEKVKKLSLVIQKIINRHVEIRAERKTGIKVSNLPKRAVFDKQGQPLKRKDGQDLLLPIYPKAFREAQQRVCSDAFLSMRSRHDQDFVNYFAETILHGPQQLSPASLQFLVGILMTNPDPNPVGRKRLCWEDVKVISMIAVSACSFNVREREAEPQRSNP
jgi:CRISPR-associated protein Cmx8